tara:strand:- start:126 stop:263 length:138 start_codon:yes stop_codon:yes gene_type:complete
MTSTDDSTVPLTPDEKKVLRQEAERKRKEALGLPENPLDDFWKRT